MLKNCKTEIPSILLSSRIRMRRHTVICHILFRSNFSITCIHITQAVKHMLRTTHQHQHAGSIAYFNVTAYYAFQSADRKC